MNLFEYFEVENQKKNPDRQNIEKSKKINVEKFIYQ